MNSMDKAYAQGVSDKLVSYGFSKNASDGIADRLARTEKSASLFNFGNSPYDGGGINLSSVLVPLAAAGAAGYVGYKSGLFGDPNRNAFANVKNYLGALGDKYVRRSRPRPMYDLRPYS